MDKQNETKEEDNGTSENVKFTAGCSAGKSKKGRAVRWSMAPVFAAAYFTLMAFTFIEGISPEHIIWAILLYAASAGLWAPYFMYLIKGKPFLLLEMISRNGESKTLIKVLCHAAYILLAFGLLAVQFALR